MRNDANSKSVSSLVAALVIVVIILAASVGYFAIYGKSVTSVTTTPTMVNSTVTSTSKSIIANPLLLYSADSQVNESTAFEAGFTAQTGIPMAAPVVAGSGTLASNIKAGDPVSIFLSVSRSSVGSSALGTEFPGWAIAFASDQVGIAYTSSSLQTTAGKAVLAAYTTAINANTTGAWFDFFNNLTSGSVKVGISNPNTDPAGYRGWMVLELAGIAFDGGAANEQYFVNRMLESHGNITGASAAALVPALLTGQIQFLFYYKSAITSAGLNMLQLSNGVNLAQSSYNSFYSQATYPTNNGLEKGSAMLIWLTVPKDSTDSTNSVSFVVYVVQNYQTVLKDFGLVSVLPAQLYNTTGYTVPAPLVSLLDSGTLVDEGPV